MVMVPEIFQYDFMIRAFLAGTFIAVMAPSIGLFLVVRRYSLMADTLAHISLAGVALGLLLHVSPVTTSLVVAVAAAFGVEKLRATGKIFGESALALFFWAGMAVAVVLIGLAKGFTVDLFSFLFGSVVTVTREELVVMAVMAVLVEAIIIIFFKELFIVSFDEELAQASGIRAKELNLLIVILAAVTISLSLRIVGILLIGALMVIPVITAMLFSRSFKHTMALSIVLSFVSVFCGLTFSYYFALASGGTIVLTALALFMAGLLLAGKR